MINKLYSNETDGKLLTRIENMWEICECIQHYGMLFGSKSWCGERRCSGCCLERKVKKYLDRARGKIAHWTGINFLEESTFYLPLAYPHHFLYSLFTTIVIFLVTKRTSLADIVFFNAFKPWKVDGLLILSHHITYYYWYN